MQIRETNLWIVDTLSSLERFLLTKPIQNHSLWPTNECQEYDTNRFNITFFSAKRLCTTGVVNFFSGFKPGYYLVSKTVSLFLTSECCPKNWAWSCDSSSQTCSRNAQPARTRPVWSLETTRHEVCSSAVMKFVREMWNIAW